MSFIKFKTHFLFGGATDFRKKILEGSKVAFIADLPQSINKVLFLSMEYKPHLSTMGIGNAVVMDVEGIKIDVRYKTVYTKPLGGEYSPMLISQFQDLVKELGYESEGIFWKLHSEDKECFLINFKLME